jgi:hypothetical protein
MSKETAAAILTQTYFQNYGAARKELKKREDAESFPSPIQGSSIPQGQQEIIRVFDAFLSQLEK